MAVAGFPGKFPGVPTTGYRSIGAVQKQYAGSAGFPGKFPGIPTTGYFTIGAVQKAQTQAIVGGGFANTSLFGSGTISQSSTPTTSSTARYRSLGLGLGLGISRRTNP